jgi:hypothetical protein
MPRSQFYSSLFLIIPDDGRYYVISQELLIQIYGLARDFTGIRQQRQVPGTFHFAGYGSLVLGARAGLAARADFSILRDVAAKQIVLFVIQNDRLIRAELANHGV